MEGEFILRRCCVIDTQGVQSELNGLEMDEAMCCFLLYRATPRAYRICEKRACNFQLVK